MASWSLYRIMVLGLLGALLGGVLQTGRILAANRGSSPGSSHPIETKLVEIDYCDFANLAQIPNQLIATLGLSPSDVLLYIDDRKLGARLDSAVAALPYSQGNLINLEVSRSDRLVRVLILLHNREQTQGLSPPWAGPSGCFR